MCGQPYDWRKPNWLLTLQFGDTTNERVGFLSYGAPAGECDNMLSTLKLFTNLMKGNKFGVAEALATCICVDNECESVGYHGRVGTVSRGT